jgi:hypothetical protein
MDYHFQSTMFGWQVFMGGWLVMLMVFSLLLRWWRDFLGAGDVITDAHFHDVGKLCFAFTAFWGYLTFSQFLVIWYGCPRGALPAPDAHRRGRSSPSRSPSSSSARRSSDSARQRRQLPPADMAFFAGSSW